MSTERRGDDANVDVRDGVELSLGVGEPIRARLTRIDSANLVARGAVDANRVGESFDEVGDSHGEDLLLVGHRRGVVDHEEQIELNDLITVVELEGVGRIAARFGGAKGLARASAASDDGEKRDGAS